MTFGFLKFWTGTEMKTTLKCPLCGKEFDEGAMKCGGCLLSKNCNLICCPHCGYSFKERSAIVDFVKSLWKRKAKS
jgi:hypothetical protein